jgi:uncharacterized membrane protein YcaP (DUF421 family)
MLTDVINRERLEPREVLAAIRKKGFLDVSKVAAVVLESDGSISVIAEPAENVESSSLQGVANSPVSEEVGR